MERMELCGFDRVFNKFCEMNAAAEGYEHDPGKVREKYTNILDAVGIDVSMLKTQKKVTGIDGDTIKGNSYIFPVKSVGFCAEIINRYTSKDFKKLRTANFRDTSMEEIQFLIDGFCDMLYGLGVSDENIRMQYHTMERRMHYKIRLSERQLNESLTEISQQAEDFEGSVCSFNYDDGVYFIRYMAEKVHHLKEYISSLYTTYTDIRSEELSDLAKSESEKESVQESLNKVNRELALGYALEHDEEYQKLQKTLEKLLVEDTFIKNKKARFNKLQDRLDEIRKQCQTELFGELLPEDLDMPLTVKHPLTVLREAVEYTDEVFADDVKRAETEASKTPEDIEKEKRQYEEIRKILESRGVNCDLPNTDKEEEEIFMNSGNLAYELKGMIQFPCCEKEKIMVYEGSSGKCSIKCPKCGRYAIFDYDKMTAVPGEILRGAAHRLKQK